MGDRKKWSSVRSYLCGDEFNSVLAEEDSASVKSSEATVTQPMQEDSIQSNEIKEEEEAVPVEKQNSISRIFQKEDAAVIIQAAFRSYLVRLFFQKSKFTMNECACELGYPDFVVLMKTAKFLNFRLGVGPKKSNWQKRRRR